MKIFRKNKKEEQTMKNDDLNIDEVELECGENSEDEQPQNPMHSEEDKDGSEDLEEEKAETETEEDADPLEAAQKEIEELKDKYLRAVAEFDNYRKRTIKEKAELILNGSEKAIAAILPVLDDMDRAITNNEKVEDAEAMKDGLALIYNKFTKVLESLGVKAIETEGVDFNVDLHEAIAMVPGMGDDKKGKVIDCIQKGYKLNDKVIRHAKVAVGQ